LHNQPTFATLRPRASEIMDTRLLKLFCAVAEEGALVAAARRLHLTPSAISHGLKALETDLGCRLFDRVGKRLLLNRAGQQLLAEVRQPLSQLANAAALIRRHAKEGQERLSIGAAPSVCHYLLPAVLRELRKAHPRLELVVQTGEVESLRNLLDGNVIDLFVASGLARHDGLVVHPLFRDELMLVFAASHPWADVKPLTSERIRGQSLILYHRTSVTARQVIAGLDDIGFSPVTVMQVGSIGAIKELVRLGLGVSVLAPWVASRELQRGLLKMRPLARKPLRRQWLLATLAGRQLSAAGEDFRRLCRTHAAGMRLDRRDIPSR